MGVPTAVSSGQGILVYTDNRLVDPWLVLAATMQATERLAPLVALLPAYMHPYAAATMVASLAFMYRRRVHINLLAGGFKLDLEALGDTTPHDERCERATAYAEIMQCLLSSNIVHLRMAMASLGGLVGCAQLACLARLGGYYVTARFSTRGLALRRGLLCSSLTS